jgi:hypothetical protein
MGDEFICFGPPLQDTGGDVEAAIHESSDEVEIIESIEPFRSGRTEGICSSVSNLDGSISNGRKRRMKPDIEAANPKMKTARLFSEDTHRMSKR